MICRRNYCLTRNMKFGNSFKDSWRSIFKKYQSYLDKAQKFIKDDYLNEVPLFQNLLTDNENISNEKIQYSNFNQISFEEMNHKNLYECFHGILNYIYYYSGNKFNIEEIEIHYSGSKSRESLMKMDKYNKTNPRNQHDIMNIFDYENINTEFTIGIIKNAFFGVTFKRIQINPISYSIRSGVFSNNRSHLISFTFEGYNEETCKWDILDERENINDLISEGSYHMFFVRKTGKYYSSFKIKQIRPSSNDFWGFSISGFEIHGNISYRENIPIQNQNFFEQKAKIKDIDINKDINNILYDPMIDMTEYF